MSLQLIRNLGEYAGTPPHFRIGGNTQDQMIYTPSWNRFWPERNRDITDTEANIASDSWIFGPTYWEALDRFPQGTPITFGLNMAYQGDAYGGYLSHVVGEAQAALDNLNNVNLVSFEMGNEPDLWLQNGFRQGTWGGEAYTDQWLERVDAVYQQVLRSRNIGSNFFEPACTASTIGTTFQIRDLMDLGIGVQAPDSSTSYIAAWNQHDYFYFIDVSGYELTLDILMTLPRTRDQFIHWESQVQQSFEAGYPYALREMSSTGPIGIQGISDTFGATLWTLNFFLYGASLNISSVQMHMTDNSYASPWQPIFINGETPHVRSTYCAWTAMSQVIGNTNGTARVANVPIEGAGEYEPRTNVYAVYADDNLASLVLFNTMPANASEPSKPSLNFEIQMDSSLNNQDVYLSYLTADGADSTQNTTFNGLSWETGDGIPAEVDTTTYTARVGGNGIVQVPVRDSQAVVVNLGGKLGSANVARVSFTNSFSYPEATATTVPSRTFDPAASATLDPVQQSSADARAQVTPTSGASSANVRNGALIIGAAAIAGAVAAL